MSEGKDMAKDAVSGATTAAKDAVDSGQAATAVPEVPAASSDMATSCKLGKDTRVIEVRKTSSGGCELYYNKFNEEKSVASSGYGTQYCEEVKARIQGNLAKAGFNCE